MNQVEESNTDNTLHSVKEYYIRAHLKRRMFLFSKLVDNSPEYINEVLEENTQTKDI